MGLISRVSSRTYRFLVVLKVFCKMSDDETFEATGAAGALTYPIQCSALRKNGYAMLKGHPCKIVDMSTSKTGKHGHAKVNMTDVTEEGYLSLMDDSGDVRDDLHCNHNPELLEEIKTKFDAGDEMMITVLKALGKEMPMAI